MWRLGHWRGPTLGLEALTGLRPTAENQEGAATCPLTPELLGEGGWRPGPRGAQPSSALPLGPRPGAQLSRRRQRCSGGAVGSRPCRPAWMGRGRGTPGGAQWGCGRPSPARLDSSQARDLQVDRHQGEPRPHRLAQPHHQSRVQGPRAGTPCSLPGSECLAAPAFP